MWVFLSDSFVSIVAHRNRPTMLLVRARLPDDIRALFPRARVLKAIGADYRYRAVISRRVVARVLAKRAAEIAYGNFKNSVKDDERHASYMRVWIVMREAQSGAVRNPGAHDGMLLDDARYTPRSRPTAREWPPK